MHTVAGAPGNPAGSVPDRGKSGWAGTGPAHPLNELCHDRRLQLSECMPVSPVLHFLELALDDVFVVTVRAWTVRWATSLRATCLLRLVELLCERVRRLLQLL